MEDLHHAFIFSRKSTTQQNLSNQQMLRSTGAPSQKFMSTNYLFVPHPAEDRMLYVQFIFLLRSVSKLYQLVQMECSKRKKCEIVYSATDCVDLNKNNCQQAANNFFISKSIPE